MRKWRMFTEYKVTEKLSVHPQNKNRISLRKNKNEPLARGHNGSPLRFLLLWSTVLHIYEVRVKANLSISHFIEESQLKRYTH